MVAKAQHPVVARRLLEAAVAAPSLALALSPHGRLQLVVSLDAPPLDFALADRLGTAFSAGSGCGLLQLGAREVGTPLPPQFAFWRAFAARYVTALCALGQLPAEDDDSGPRRDPGYAGTDLQVPPPPGDRLAEMAAAAPPMAGGEYLDRTVLAALWGAIGAAVATELSASGASLADFLRACNPGWNLVGRVHFNLAENRKDPDAPFAFMATYTTRLSERNVAQHLPLGQALRASAGEADRARLMSLLQPVGRAAESCGWLKEMVDRGEIYHPLRWTAPEAFRLLRDVPALERAGVIVRMPAAWTSGKPDRPQVTATVGSAEPGHLGTDALLDFHVAVTLDGETLTASEVEELLAQSEGLALLRGRWVEIDHERLARLLDRYREIERTAADGGLGYQEAMRLLAGAGAGQEPVGEMNEAAQPWSQVVAGPWLANVLRGLRSPEGLAEVDPGEALAGTLRHYQEVGLRWLHLLTSLGLGACLADDMGLGKTIQVLALLLVRKSRQTGGARPSLLVAPASLLANWAAEAQRFAPSLAIGIAHPSGAGPAALASFKPEAYDLVITTYGQLQRLPALARLTWDLAILDEAQAIKNPAAKQTRAAKGLRAHGRIVLTGTPVENRVGDLWSLFDFVNPGLLGTAKEFGDFLKRLADRPDNQYGPLRELVRPYILRRMKSDKTIIADLPDKTEVKAYCHLSKRQAVLYQQAVDELARRVSGAAGIERRGVVLAFLTRFKQICNHPSHWLGDGAWDEAESGKFARLREIAEVAAERQQKILVFSQFREATSPVADFLGGVFGRAGLVLDGQTPIKKRQELVRAFQEDDDVPFFVLSLKAGGSGLNLTAASHVIHFDRWWNPAVEDQATDRAYRIGQKRNVLVHKFICRGTLEDRIDALIESKKQLSADLLGGGAEALLTELSDSELLNLVALDLAAASKET